MDRRSRVPFPEIWAASAGERDGSAEESSVTEQSGGSGGGRRRAREAGAAVSSSAEEGFRRVVSAVSDSIGCDVKRLKIEASKDDDGKSSAGRKMGNDAKMTDENSRPSQAPKSDYIHVRARRGQATDSHSLAERARREKISERMKILQDLVPGCNKVIGKALVLDEIINYIQSLQRQVEFLSMKLEAINAGMNLVNVEGYPGKNFAMQALDTIARPPFTSQPPREYAPEPSSAWLHMQVGGGFERAA